MNTQPTEDLVRALKRAVGALQDAQVEFLLGGGLAAWARGGPVTDHDVDLFLREADAERAQQACAEAGMRTERPPEGWLLKAYDDDVLIDLIFGPSGLEMDDAVFARADELVVMAIPMKVLSLDDLFVTKLASLREQWLNYDELLLGARALREQVDWSAVRQRAPDNPFIAAFFTLAEGLGVVGRAEPVA